MAVGDANRRLMTGVVFEPFEELKHELALVPIMPDQSLARQKYSNDCEAALNEQIKWDFFRFEGKKKSGLFPSFCSVPKIVASRSDFYRLLGNQSFFFNIIFAFIRFPLEDLMKGKGFAPLFIA